MYLPSNNGTMGCIVSSSNRVSIAEKVSETSNSSKVQLTRVTDFTTDPDITPRKRHKGVASGSSAQTTKKRVSNQTLLTLREESVLDEFKNGPGQRFFTEFPTPQLLQEAQLAFLSCKYDIPKGIEKGPAYPIQSWKKDVFRREDFSDLDTHAIQLPSSCLRDNLEQMVRTLIEPTVNSLGAVRVIFRWIAAQDISQMTFSETEQPSTAAYYLQRIQTGKGGYAELFQKMCSLANLTCVSIPGFVKGVGYDPGNDVTEHTGVWSAVLLDGCWRLVDCQWGSSHVSIDVASDLTSPDLQVVNTDMSYAYEEFYFLTDPHQLIYSHFPYDDRWQLLARPLTLDEFQKIAYLKPSFFKMGFEIFGSPKCVLMSEDGHCDLAIKLPASVNCRFVYKLYLVERTSSETRVQVDRLERYVFLQMERNSGLVSAKLFFPFTGKYKFKLFSRDYDDSSDEFSSVCSYVIYCDKAVRWTDFEPFPHNPRYEWGLGAEASALGITPVSHNSAYIETLAGEVEIRCHLTQNVEFLHKLTRHGEPESKYKNYVFHRYEKNDVIFKVKLPRMGKFMLSVFAKRVRDEGSFPNVCNFLLDCDEAAEDSSPYPAVYNGRVGPNDNFRELGMETGEDDSGFFICSESGELVIKFRTQNPVFLIPKLCLQVGDGYKELDEFTTCRNEPGTVSVHMLFPESGFYQFILYGKRPDSSNNSYPPIYYGLIQADFPKVGAMPFPKIFSNWRDTFRLLEPRCGYLSTNDSVRFLVDIPISDGVAIIGTTWTHLTRNESGLWDGILETGDTECDLKLSACLQQGSSRYSCLQLFKVISERTLRTQVEKQKAHYQECKALLKLRKQKLDRLKIGRGMTTTTGKALAVSEVEQREATQINGAERQVPIKLDDSELMKKAAEEILRNREGMGKQSLNAGWELSEEESVNDKTTNRETKADVHSAHMEWDGDERVVTARQRSAILPTENSQSRQEIVIHDTEQHGPTTEENSLDQATEGNQATRTDGDINQTVGSLPKPETKLPKAESIVSTSSDDQTAAKRKADEEKAQAAYCKLQDAMTKQDMVLLEAIIKEFRMKKIKIDRAELEEAQRLLDKIAIKHAMYNAMEDKDMPSIKRCLRLMEEKGFADELKLDMDKGLEKLKTLERIAKFKTSVLSMDARTMTEMRRYNNPPPGVHQVMAATLLLLGDHEGTTKKWKNCQKLCNPTGPQGFKKRILEFDVDQLHPEIAARAGEILDGEDFDEVAVTSSGAATFYVWTRGMVNEIAQRLTQSGETVTPANKYRQKQILLGRGDISDDEMDRPMSRVSMMRPSTTRSVRRPSISVKQ